MPQSNKPPKWILWLFVFMMLLWPALMYWLHNHYSGLSELKRYHNAGDKELPASQERSHVTLMQASGRKYNFEAQQSFPRTETGFDDKGFSIKGMDGTWAAPRGAVFIPWSAVKHCEGLRVHLRYPEMSLVIQDQPLLDACACKVMNRC